MDRSTGLILPPGFVARTLGKGCISVIPERVHVAGLRLGKTLRRREAAERRSMTERNGVDVAE